YYVTEEDIAAELGTTAEVLTGDEIDSVLGGLGLRPAREPDRVVHGSGDCSVEGRAPRHARRPTALLGVGDHHGADAAGGSPPGATPDRRVARIPSSAAWS